MQSEKNSTQTNKEDEMDTYYDIEISFYGVESQKSVFSMNMEVSELPYEFPLFTDKRTWENNPLPSYFKMVVLVSKYENVRSNRKRSTRFIEELFRYYYSFFFC